MKRYNNFPNAGGELRKSTDGGASWVTLNNLPFPHVFDNTPLNRLAINPALRLDPNNPNRIVVVLRDLAGRGQHRRYRQRSIAGRPGSYESLDGGASFTQLHQNTQISPPSTCPIPVINEFWFPGAACRWRWPGSRATSPSTPTSRS
jgi:hypothetical protein